MFSNGKKYYLLLFMNFCLFMLVAPNIYANDFYSIQRLVQSGFNNPNIKEINSLVYFKNAFYAGTYNSIDGSGIWRSTDETNWDIIQQTKNGFGDRNNIEIKDLNTWHGHLYATTKNSVTGVEIWRTSDGLHWNQVNIDGFGNTQTEYAREIVPFQEKLFVFTSNYDTGGEVWATNNGIQWNKINNPGFGNSNNTDLAAALCFDGYLYTATENENDGVEIWRYNGSSWTRTAASGISDADNYFPMVLTNFEHNMYLSLENKVSQTEILRSRDGRNWKKIGGATENPALHFVTMSEDSRLYGAALNSKNKLVTYESLDGKNWTPIQVRGALSECEGAPVLSHNGNLYSISFIPNGDNSGSLVRLTRNEPTFDSKSMTLHIPSVLLDGKSRYKDILIPF